VIACEAGRSGGCERGSAAGRPAAQITESIGFLFIQSLGLTEPQASPYGSPGLLAHAQGQYMPSIPLGSHLIPRSSSLESSLRFDPTMPNGRQA